MDGPTFEEIIQSEAKWMDADCTQESVSFEFDRLSQDFFLNLHLSGGSLKNKQMLCIISILQLEMLQQLKKGITR